MIGSYFPMEILILNPRVNFYLCSASAVLFEVWTWTFFSGDCRVGPFIETRSLSTQAGTARLPPLLLLFIRLLRQACLLLCKLLLLSHPASPCSPHPSPQIGGRKNSSCHLSPTNVSLPTLIPSLTVKLSPGAPKMTGGLGSCCRTDVFILSLL
ncbi:hypothetical protein BDZ45DRAFT_409454 [Acephala macrosclerotiorum]|nr:hypothetical protein BDZ45DRAFT_409454 [Acephala macrosclerotiorum]